jgi:hypothetical protein
VNIEVYNLKYFSGSNSIKDICTDIAKNNNISLIDYKGQAVKLHPSSFIEGIPYFCRPSIISRLWKGSCRERMIDNLNFSSNMYIGDRVGGYNITLLKLTKSFPKSCFPKIEKSISTFFKWMHLLVDNIINNRTSSANNSFSDFEKYLSVETLGNPDISRDVKISVVYPVINHYGSLNKFLFHSLMVLLFRSGILFTDKGNLRDLTSFHTQWRYSIKNRSLKFRNMDYMAESDRKSLLNRNTFCMFTALLFIGADRTSLSSEMRGSDYFSGPLQFFKAKPDIMIKRFNSYNLWPFISDYMGEHNLYNNSYHNLPEDFYNALKHWEKNIGEAYSSKKIKEKISEILGQWNL